MAVNTCGTSWRPLETDKTVGWRAARCKGVRRNPVCLTLAQHYPSFDAAQPLSLARHEPRYEACCLQQEQAACCARVSAEHDCSIMLPPNLCRIFFFLHSGVEAFAFVDCSICVRYLFIIFFLYRGSLAIYMLFPIHAVSLFCSSHALAVLHKDICMVVITAVNQAPQVFAAQTNCQQNVTCQ